MRRMEARSTFLFFVSHHVFDKSKNEVDHILVLSQPMMMRDETQRIELKSRILFFVCAHKE